VQQLKATLEAEKRAAVANQRRMVAENAELIQQLRQAQGGAATTCPAWAASPAAAAGGACRAGSAGGGSRRGTGCSRPGSRGSAAAAVEAPDKQPQAASH
jgi:hypothetical protein